MRLSNLTAVRAALSATAIADRRVMADISSKQAPIPADCAAVEVSGLVKDFPGVRAVDHLSFRVAAGEIFGLVGPDGAGKSTTMRVLAGVMAPDEGTASVCGYDVAHDPEAVKRNISYMPQRFGLYEDLTVKENIRFYADL